MKKAIGIIVLGLLWCNVGFAEILGINKTVNDYVDDNYTIISVVTSKSTILYTLRSNAKSKPLVVTCAYSIEKDSAICFAP